MEYNKVEMENIALLNKLIDNTNMVNSTIEDRKTNSLQNNNKIEEYFKSDKRKNIKDTVGTINTALESLNTIASGGQYCSSYLSAIYSAVNNYYRQNPQEVVTYTEYPSNVSTSNYIASEINPDYYKYLSIISDIASRFNSKVNSFLDNDEYSSIIQDYTMKAKKEYDENGIEYINQYVFINGKWSLCL